jgi:hypothetical protein
MHTQAESINESGHVYSLNVCGPRAGRPVQVLCQLHKYISRSAEAGSSDVGGSPVMGSAW